MKIENAIVLVTGANRGIGKAIVLSLHKMGAAKIYAGARRVETLKGFVSIDAPRIVPIEIDVTSSDAVDALAKHASDITLLINNAGTVAFGNILEASLVDIERNFAVNFYGQLSMARAFAPVIAKNGGGAIVNLLTFLALASAPSLAIYNASKAAAWSMTQSIRATLREKNITVHAVFPGAVDTDMLAGVEMRKASPATVAAAIISGIENGDEDIFPDRGAAALYEVWKADHKAVERQLATL